MTPRSVVVLLHRVLEAYSGPEPRNLARFHFHRSAGENAVHFSRLVRPAIEGSESGDRDLATALDLT